MAARRKEEVDVIFVQRLYWTIISMLAQSTPLLIDVSTLSIYVVATGKPLTAAVGFTVLTLTGIIQRPASGFARTVQVVLDYGVSLKRLSRYMMAAEIADQVELAPGQKGHVHYPHRRAIDNGRWAVKMEVPLVVGCSCSCRQKAGLSRRGRERRETAVVFSSRMLLLLPSRQRKQHHKRQNESQGENDEKDQGICKRA